VNGDSVTDIREEARDGFERIFGYPAHGLWSAPGALRLIGDHTDYAEGHTLTVTIDRRVVVALGVSKESRIRVASPHAGEIAEIPLTELDKEELSGWPSYPLGVAWALGRVGVDLQAVPGVDMYVESTVPERIGLGSSAALTAAVALALSDAWRVGSDMMMLARACALAEGRATGEEVGIGPAIAALSAKPDSGLLIDERSKDVDQIRLGFDDGDIVLLFIRCESEPTPLPPLAERLAALEEVADRLDAGSMRNVKPADIHALTPDDHLSEETLSMARHVVEEDLRVLQSVQKLREEGPDSLTSVFADSHESVIRAYGLGTPSVQLAVSTALENGAFAARLLGHRSTGTVMAICPEGSVSRIIQALDGAFSEHALDIPDTVVCRVGTKALRH
jgi:galactokinase